MSVGLVWRPVLPVAWMVSGLKTERRGVSLERWANDCGCEAELEFLGGFGRLLWVDLCRDGCPNGIGLARDIAAIDDDAATALPHEEEQA